MGSLDNTTPEAISPTMTEARAKPTESSKIPEIESSVREQVDVVEKMGGVAVLSDNPGVSNPTGNTKDVTHENVDTTEPITDETKTASYDRGTNDQEKNHPGELTEKIQVNKPIVENDIPFSTTNEDEGEMNESNEVDEKYTIDGGDDEIDDLEDDYI